MESVQCSLQEGLNGVSKWWDQIRRVVHTKSMALACRLKHQLKPLLLNLTLGTNITEQVREHRVLGITTDEVLNWQPYIGNICKQVARNLFWPGQFRKCVDIDCCKLFFNTHLLAHINYASIVWSNATEVHFKKINKKNQLLPQTSSKTYYLITPSMTAKLKKLDILPLQEQFVYNTAVLMFKVHMGWTLRYVCDLPSQRTCSI